MKQEHGSSNHRDLSKFLKDAVRSLFRRPPDLTQRKPLPHYKMEALVDVANRDELYRVMEGG